MSQLTVCVPDRSRRILAMKNPAVASRWGSVITIPVRRGPGIRRPASGVVLEDEIRVLVQERVDLALVLRS